MTKKWFVRFIAILMAAIMVLSVLYIAANSFTGAAVSQSQIDVLKQKKKEIEKKKAEIQAKINTLEYEQATALAKKEVLDDQINYTQDEIDNITEQIEEYTQMIILKEQEVKDAQANEDSQLVRYKANMRTMEENGTISYIAVIFDANSFTDLLSRIDMVGSIMDYGENLYQQLKASKEATIQAKADLEQSKAEQEADKVELQSKEVELSTQLEAANALLQKIESDIKAAKDLYKQESAEANSIQSDINKKIEELNKNPQTVKGTGTLVWPAPSCTIVTSQYGMRYHPVFGEYRMHNGVDIGAKYGANIVAADSGTVITSKYSSSYGNYIVVSHGNGITTLYAHLSSRLVKEGASVTQGQTIGKCGSTGNSTGPHLHFEVSVNGSRVNPLKYYSNYSIKG